MQHLCTTQGRHLSTICRHRLQGPVYFAKRTLQSNIHVTILQIWLSSMLCLRSMQAVVHESNVNRWLRLAILASIRAADLLWADVLVSVLCQLCQQPSGELRVKDLAQRGPQCLAFRMLLTDVIPASQSPASWAASLFTSVTSLQDILRLIYDCYCAA